MRILVDSNVLTRLAHPSDPQHQVNADATRKLRQANEELCIVPQNVYEFWAVASRPASVNGLGFTVSKVQAEVATLRSLFTLLDEAPAVFAEWEKLVAAHGVIGKNVHDARLVAAMIVHGIPSILTFNKQDFQRYAVNVLLPADVVAATP